MEMSFRRSKSIVACGQSHREADGAVWGFATERYTFIFILPISSNEYFYYVSYKSTKQLSILSIIH